MGKNTNSGHEQTGTSSEVADWPLLGLPAVEDLIRHGHDMITVVDDDGLCTYASPALVRIGGFKNEEVVGKDAALSVHPDDRERVLADGRKQIEGLSPRRPIRFRQTNKSGEHRLVEAVVAPLPHDHPLGAVVVNTRDITNRELDQLAREEAHVIVRMVAEGQPLEEVLISVVDSFQRQFDGASVAILRLDRDSDALRVAVAPKLPKGFTNALDGLEIGPNAGSAGAAAYTKEPVIVGDIKSDDRWKELHPIARKHQVGAAWATPVLSSDDRSALGVICVFWSEAKVPSLDHVRLLKEATGLTTVAFERYRIEGELAHQATHDALTGLPNRTLLENRIEHALAQQRREEVDPVSVLFVDLDGFKAVNDEHGHGVGDKLLVQVANRILETVRETDTVARYGGDEFVVVCNSLSVEVLAGRINSSMREEFDIENQVLNVTCSVGIATSVDGTEEAESLAHRADEALYKAKGDGKDCYSTSPS